MATSLPQKHPTVKLEEERYFYCQSQRPKQAKSCAKSRFITYSRTRTFASVITLTSCPMNCRCSTFTATYSRRFSNTLITVISA